MSSPPVSVPTIDFAAFEGPDPESHALVVSRIADACSNVGFFYVANHGIEESVLLDALRHARGFFDQPLAVKMRVASLKKGYIPVGGCDNAVRPTNLHEKFSCGPVDVDASDAYYVGATDPRAATYFGEENRWPDHDGGSFRVAYERYYRECAAFVDKVLRAFAEALTAPRHFFAESSKKHVSNLVALRYPPLAGDAVTATATPPGANPSETRERLRVLPHTDPTDITVLCFENGPSGLQVLPEGCATWIDVPEAPRAHLLVNLGDASQFWTNDAWRSARHRVVARTGETETNDRLSLIFFHAPDYDCVIDASRLAAAQTEPGERVVREGAPRKYPAFEFSERAHFAQLERGARGEPDRQVLDESNERRGLA